MFYVIYVCALISLDLNAIVSDVYVLVDYNQYNLQSKAIKIRGLQYTFIIKCHLNHIYFIHLLLLLISAIIITIYSC